MKDAFEHELRARLRDLEHERRDVSVLHDHETGDHAFVLRCPIHGPYVPLSLTDQTCPPCEVAWLETYRPTNRPLPPVRRDK